MPRVTKADLEALEYRIEVLEKDLEWHKKINHVLLKTLQQIPENVKYIKEVTEDE